MPPVTQLIGAEPGFEPRLSTSVALIVVLPYLLALGSGD